MPTVSIFPDEPILYRAVRGTGGDLRGHRGHGVRTIGIFCRLTCPVRKPNGENVEFFPRPGDALATGSRPCRRCGPSRPKGLAPDWLQPMLEAVDVDPARLWMSQDLRAHEGGSNA